MTPHWIDIPIGTSVNKIVAGLRGLADQMNQTPGLHLYSIAVDRLAETPGVRITFGLDTADEIRRRANASQTMPEVPAPDTE